MDDWVGVEEDRKLNRRQCRPMEELKQNKV